MSWDGIIWMVGVGVIATFALVAAGYGALDLEDAPADVIFLIALAVISWPLALAMALVVAVCYLPYRGGKALAAAAERRQMRQSVEKRERIAALHDLRNQYPRDSLTWQVLNDQIHDL